jgi:hypothetical protein
MKTKANSRRALLSLLVMSVAAVVLSILSVIAYRLGRQVETERRFLDPRRALTSDEASVVHPIEYALRSKEKNEVIFIGDSTCHDGVDPLVFERNTGLRAFNLGSQRGLGPIGFVVTARAYLEHHPKPRLLVLCVSPVALEVDTGTAGGDLPDQFVANYGPEVTGVVGFSDSLAYFIKRGALSVFDSTRNDYLDVPLIGMEKETYRSLERKMRVSRGFFCLPGTHGPMRGIDRSGPPKLIHDDWNRGIRSLAAACADVGTILLVRYTPISSQISDARDFSPLGDWAGEFESSFKSARVARPILLVYDPQFMWDSIHLNSVGVERFTQVVATDALSVLSGK